MIYKWLTPSALWLKPRRCRIAHTYHGHIFHSYYGAAKTKLFVRIERALARACTDRVIVISEQQRREIGETFRVGRREQFRVVPLGLDLDEISERRGALREELGIKDGEVAVGIVGRLCEVKNHAMFLDAAARLSPLSEPARFVVIGDGNLRAEMEQLSRASGISERVRFTGFREDATTLYADLDVVALTSLNEGTPLTLIEAMCCGRAVAATAVGGVVDVMGERRGEVDGFTVWDHGVTAPSRDAESFARALKYLIERPELRREMGERGRAFVRARLSKARLLNDVENLYREMTGIREAAPSRDAEILIQS
jgi:glycosyltransferase involved in cell wall biosynthesis